MDDEFDNFVQKVTEVENLVKQLRCSDKVVAERAQRLADQILGAGRGDQDLVGGGHGGLVCRKDRTLINRRAFDNMSEADDPSHISKETFMAQVERDAEKRAKDQKERKQRSDELKMKANIAFRAKEFEKALDLYNKAIDETRDSTVLYENRALTSLHLKLYRRAVEDCDWALRLSNNSLKALLYKARALLHLEEKEKSHECILVALKKHPNYEKLIKEYEELWISQP